MPFKFCLNFILKKKKKKKEAKSTYVVGIITNCNHITDEKTIDHLTNLHLGTTILEPKLDLPNLKAKPLTELQPLLFIWMWALLEHAIKTHKNTPINIK